MSPLESTPARLLVVLDREYGDRLQAIWPGQPVWIELSPTNKPVVEQSWRDNPNPSHLTGITGLMFKPEINAEERFLAELDTIDLHHGAYSTHTPYTELEVLGCMLNNQIRAALAELGFDNVEDKAHGFVARRTHEEAAIRRPRTQ